MLLELVTVCVVMNVPGGGVMTYGQLPNVWPGCPVTPGQGQHPTLHLGQEEEQSIDIIHTHYTHAPSCTTSPVALRSDWW